VKKAQAEQRVPGVGKGLRPDQQEIVEKVYRLVGLGVRSRGVVVGTERVRAEAKNGRLRLAIVAMDASENTLDKLVPLLKARDISFIEMPSAARLGAAVGRDSTAAVGVMDPPLARGLRDLLQPRSPRARREDV
jgi:ribosomal protein L7Ae-like RNA K-turn-binding protein